ncbi:multidrug ABC transporter ATP-binding protein [Thermosipho melanesiensis]|uniref:ABC transporter, transmembrane region n=2 Tax=Thermosipho melanesiensis TaxID=46541 RepID=A6LJA9_THEM4|nr:ABC transporter ATP-binding protein [Thermosipho melanesiensis]ABR30010.1 ABC transporter, transmembrane region [Thermosipho melanesiensis BI429]APT73214.1 multidrug ABC transporter ATP-binding protein [Thermosipho melanesiensis]OOC38607.1 multidrug ABC transporter ATP-binding protein [Thermosipho melanesiensis]OOC40411.1 multidrug ABC transporter ATP-binding protein [Thermosipho melanesiensis]OOC40675.1 multidrug ABC transporter ATP-binding protein [Thermosipho melanesiensis]
MSEKRPVHRGGPGGPIRGAVERPKNFRKALKRLLGYLKPYTVPLIIVFAMAITGTVFSIIAPKVLGKATTKLFQGFLAKRLFSNARIDLDGILQILIKVGILYGIFALFMYIQQYIMAGISQKVVKKLRTEIMEKLSKLPLKFYDSRTHGEILSRVTNDVDLISNTLNQSLTQLITSLVTIVGVIIMMLTISPLLTLVTLVTLPISISLIVFIVKKSQKYFKNQQNSLGSVNGHVEEMFSGLIVVKGYNREEDSIEKFEKYNEELFGASWKAQFISGITMPIMRFVGNLGYVIVSIMGGIMVTKRAIQLGDVQAFIQYSQQFNQPISQVANIMNMIQSTLAAAERVFEILDEEEEKPDPQDAVELEKVEGNIKFENVYFSYREDKKLIEDLNIEVRSGQTIAIVGPTGAGKTTLVNLLMRFYEIQGGSITIDGVDIRKLKRNNLRKFFGMVLQDTWLFNGTIRENIAYGKENATEEEIIRAAKLAHAHHFIMALPGGYDAMINEEASNISQGEKQLITIARAFVADPDILILDEATSNVDTLTEKYIQSAMKRLMHSRTNFVIAHRLSTIRDADMILVMNEGQIIEKGTHKQLMEKNGFYAELYKSQFLGAYV